jgi:cyclopropane-fatty-acyl-phospholipid synthase
MSTATRPLAPEAAAATRTLAALTAGYAGNFAVRLWTGDAWEPAAGPTPFTLVLKHPGSLRAMFWPFSRISLGESYIFDDFDIEGDVLAFTGWLRHIVRLAETGTLGSKLRLLWSLLRLPNRANPRDPSKAGRPTEGDHSRDREREAISYSYDPPDEFFRLFLDPHMQYSCAYFARPDEDLDRAQERKMDYICRKLRLAPGERLVDFGCGWGGLVVHAAKHYGVEAVGVTLSKGQAARAVRRVEEAGLKDRVRIVISDYRDFHDPAGFDKASSVGMAEHIGVKNLPVYFKAVYDNLRPGGAYLHHSITLRPFTPYPRWTAFARKYVFPNGELQTILRVQESAALAGFEVRDVENLREHYVLTLENWVRRLEANREEVVRLVGEVSYRIFRIYMAGATLGFRYGTYGLYQCLVVKPEDGSANLPLTRAEWYR